MLCLTQKKSLKNQPNQQMMTVVAVVHVDVSGCPSGASGPAAPAGMASLTHHTLTCQHTYTALRMVLLSSPQLVALTAWVEHDDTFAGICDVRH